MKNSIRAAARRVLVAMLFTAPPAFSQASLIETKAHGDVKTDVAKEGFQKAEAPPAAPVRETEAKVSAGGFFSTGNSRSIAVTAAAFGRMRRGEDQYTVEAAANFANASTSPLVDPEDTVENYQGRVRYDRFLGKKWALFAQESGRRDRFQGLDLRLNFDPGVTYYFLIEEKQHLSFDAGYDLQYDLRSADAVTEADALGTPITKTEVRHAVRLYAGYDNALNDYVSFQTGVEYLQAFVDPENFRINWMAGLTSTIAGSFSTALNFTLRYDNNPLPAVEELDTITTVSLVYQLR